MRKLLESQGWKMYKTCSCGGTRTEKFNHPDYPSKEFWVKPNRNRWEYRIGRPVFAAGTGVEQLTIHLKTI
jgi:hypothetical protein